MLLFSDPRPMRRAVMVTLVVWVFGLMAGIANACLLQDAQPVHHGQAPRHSSSGPSVGSPPDPLATSAHEALASPAEPSGDAGPYQASCKKFCDTGASAAVKQEGCDTTDSGHAAVHACGWNPKLAPVAVAKQLFNDRPFPHDTPIAIRFLRLTL